MRSQTSHRVVAAILAAFLAILSGCSLRIPLGPGPDQALEFQWFSPVQASAPEYDLSREKPASQPSE